MAVFARAPGGLDRMARWVRPTVAVAAGTIVLTFLWNRFSELGFEVMKPLPVRSNAGCVTAAEPMPKWPYSKISVMPSGSKAWTILIVNCWLAVVCSRVTRRERFSVKY